MHTTLSNTCTDTPIILHDLMPKPPLKSRCAPISSKHNSTTVISCETLSKVDWYSRRPQLHYYSDVDEEGDGEGKPASDADDEHEDADIKKAAHDNHEHHKEEYKLEGRGRTQKFEARYGYGEASSDQGRLFPPTFPPQSVYDKHLVANSSPGRDVKKGERMPRTYPGSIPHSGNLLPHSGILLPNYMNMHHNSGSHVHNKGSTSIKAATLIPSHITGRKSSKGTPPFSANANEPSSPKVTCLGRVKIKHKYYREMGKLADMQAATLSSDKTQMPGKKGVNKDGSSMPTAELKRSKHGSRVSHTEAITILDPASDSDTKVKKGIRRTLKEAKSHMKLHREKKKSHLPNAPLAPDRASSNVEIAIDLGRFRSVQGQESSLSQSSATLPIGEYVSCYDTGFVSQVPPTNSLLLMRNSKSRVAGRTSTSSRRSIAEYGVIVDGESDVSRQQAYLSLLKGGSSKKSSSSLSEVKVADLDAAAMENGYDQQGAFLSELYVKKLCAVVAEECKPLHRKKNAMAYRQASLPKATPEARLWQRRCIVKPSDLDVGRPIALQVSLPSTR